MAKSLRSKSKRAFRAKKREDGIYAATHAARLERLHAKIEAIVATPKPAHDEILEDIENAEGNEEVQEEEMAGECQPWTAITLWPDFMGMQLITNVLHFPRRAATQTQWVW